MDEIKIPKGDAGYAITLQINDADGDAKSCSSYTTAKLQVWRAGKDPETPANLIIDTALGWNDADTGDAYYTIEDGVFDTAGTYHARIFLAKTGVEERLETFAIVIDDDIAQTWEIVTLEEANAHLRIDDTTDDLVVTRMIKAAYRYCEGFQRRSYITQTRTLWLDSFPADDYIEIPFPPLQSITSVEYYDTSDTEATFSASSYYVDSENEPGRVSLNYGQSWPSTTLRPRNGVKVTYVAGYGTELDDLPDVVRQAMLMLVAHWYENREAVMIGATSKEIELAVESLLWLERVFT